MLLVITYVEYRYSIINSMENINFLYKLSNIIVFKKWLDFMYSKNNSEAIV